MFFAKMSKVTKKEEKFEFAKTVLCGPLKGTPYTEKVLRTTREILSVNEGTGVKHGLCITIKDVECFSLVWNPLKQSLVEQKTGTRQEISETYVDGIIAGVVVKKNFSFSVKRQEYVLVSTSTMEYKDGKKNGVYRAVNGDGELVIFHEFLDGELWGRQIELPKPSRTALSK
ncbi:hypothetical protein GMAR_ORF89 [Golden Marseillevirus]|uniref:hypothetical protein n=1 Tax=Golden Marseillevirus TaxID=1720526 RepID=UPI000877AE9C|nr:hypothetical protein GMAR_ORF89 [Golden Marseillevirus]ALX27464.1 hypothetical protein GMAR_ORF89 [Golden Marseillevirus]